MWRIWASIACSDQCLIWVTFKRSCEQNFGLQCEYEPKNIAYVMYTLLLKSFHCYFCINHSPYPHILVLFSFVLPILHCLCPFIYFPLFFFDSLLSFRLSYSIVLPPSNHPLITLKVRLVPVSFEDPDFLASYEQSAALYARYQMTVHGDAPYECGESEVQT